MSKIIEVYHKGERYEVLVDDDLVLPKRIFKQGKYFGFKINGKNIYLHRWVIGVTDKKIQVDHINNNKLDNRKENLRVCTNQQNSANKIVKGYYLHKGSRKWMARIKIDYKSKYLGSYDTPEEAQQVYRKAHAEAFGEFSPYYEYYSGITKEVN